jgi:4-hydroxythreonine-4-phosphate dehydrogenase
LILRRLRVLHRDLSRRFRLPAPRLAVTALNPHAGEGGLLGDEEQTIIAPAIQQAQKEGIAAEGRFPPTRSLAGTSKISSMLISQCITTRD